MSAMRLRWGGSSIERFAVIAGTLLLAYAAFAQAFAQVADRQQPLFAHALWPVSGQLSARLSELYADPATGWSPPAGVEFARRALLTEPLAVNALRVLGVSQSDPARARRALHLAERLSKRDLPTQAWLVQQAAAQGDLDRVLVHYDTALRGSTAGARLLMPRLVKAMAIPQAVAPFARLSDRDPPWFASFAGSVAATGDLAAVRNLSAVLLARPKLFEVVERRTIGSLVARLAKDERYGEAERLYTGLPGQSDAPIRHADFRVIDPIAPFDWRLAPDPAVSAGAVQGGLAILVTQPAEHLVAEQLLSLSPGQWRMAGGSSIQAGMLGQGEWRVICAAGGRSLATLAVRSRSAVPVTVPSACSHQWLRLAVRREGEAALEMTISPLQLTPARRRTAAPFIRWSGSATSEWTRRRR